MRLAASGGSGGDEPTKFHAKITQCASDSVKHITEVFPESGMCAEDDMLTNFETVVYHTVHRISSEVIIDFGDEPSSLSDSASTADTISSNNPVIQPGVNEF